MEREKLVALVTSVQRGEPDAATELYNSFFNDIYYFIQKTVKDPTLAEDLTQDTFLKILETIGELQEPAAFVTWSRQIAYHKCTDHFKKRKELLCDENEDGTTVFDTLAEDREEFIPDEALDKQELRKTIQAMIVALPEEQRSAILLRYFEELSVQDIARIQGVSEGTVKSRLNYGRKAIKGSVETYEKKTGTKLRCVGIVPMLLWLGKYYRAAENGKEVAKVIGSAAKTALGAGMTEVAKDVAKEAAKDVAKEAAKDVAKDAAKSGVRKSVKILGKEVSKKAVAAVVAAAVASGGATVAITSQSSHAEPQSNVWVGYGKNTTFMEVCRYEIEIGSRDEETISGHITGEYLYTLQLDSDFEGTVTGSEDTLTYAIELENPATGYRQNMELTIDEDRQEIYLENYGIVITLEPQQKSDPVLVENGNWKGIGKDSRSSRDWDSEFRLSNVELREQSIRGDFTVTHEGEVAHDSSFTGRGYHEGGVYYYEIKLDTPREFRDFIGNQRIQYFWLVYDKGRDTFAIEGVTWYYMDIMDREK